MFRCQREICSYLMCHPVLLCRFGLGWTLDLGLIYSSPSFRHDSTYFPLPGRSSISIQWRWKKWWLSSLLCPPASSTPTSSTSPPRRWHIVYGAATPAPGPPVSMVRTALHWWYFLFNTLMTHLKFDDCIQKTSECNLLAHFNFL